MRIVLQRVLSATVNVDGAVVGQIGVGLVALVGVGGDDTPEVATTFARKTARLRVFRTDPDDPEQSVADIGGEVLVVSQFTLLAETGRGNRPSWSAAAPAAQAEALVEQFAQAIIADGVPVQRGRFGAQMRLELVNDGPLTIILE